MSAGPLNSPMLGLGAGPDAMLASGLARSIKENGADGFPTASGSVSARPRPVSERLALVPL